MAKAKKNEISIDYPNDAEKITGFWTLSDPFTGKDCLPVITR